MSRRKKRYRMSRRGQIATCIRRIRLSLHHLNRDEANAAVDALFAECQQKPVTGETPLIDLISVRTANALDEYLGCRVVDDMFEVTESDLAGVPNIGPTARAEIRTALHDVVQHYNHEK